VYDGFQIQLKACASGSKQRRPLAAQ
jgi:hypothetical protein